MNKYFVFSDVHGEYDALLSGLNRAGYDSRNPSHILVSLGDNFDRGPESREVYELLRHSKSICVKGNHEEFFQEALEKEADGEMVLFNILHNGLLDTIKSFGYISDIGNLLNYNKLNAILDCIKSNCSVLDFIRDMPLYYETKNYIFVHAGFNESCALNPLDTNNQEYMLWDIKDSHKPLDFTRKTVIIGHHHAFRVRKNAIAAGYNTSYPNCIWVGNEDDNAPVKIGNKIAIDPCSNLTHKINILVIEDEPLQEEEKKDDNKAEQNLNIRVDNTIWSYYGNDYTYVTTADPRTTTRL